MGSKEEYARDEVFALTLSVRHPMLDPQVFAQAFDLQHYDTQAVGQPRTTPKGRPLTGSYSESSYNADLISPDEFKQPDFDCKLESCLALALERLQPSYADIERFRDAGARVIFSVGWVVRSNGGADLSADLLTRLGTLGIAVWLDVYGKSSQNEE